MSSISECSIEQRRRFDHGVAGGTSIPLSALREIRRVLKTGGTLAVLENDIFHHILLPWPVELEVPVERALQRAARARFGSSAKLAPVRRLPRLFESAGYSSYHKRTFAADRQAPWTPTLRRFLELHVEDLRRMIHPYLPRTIRRRYHDFTATSAAESLFGDRAMDMTCLNVLYEARK